MKIERKQYYKFLNYTDGKLVSTHNNQEWVVGKTVSVKGTIKACSNGLHASEQPLQALYYVKGTALALVEAWGDSDNQDDDKVCYRNMRIIKVVEWTKTDSVTTAIYAAEQVIKIYEDKYPNDSRPRDAIKAAKAYLKNPNKKAAYAAYAAAYAADAAAYAADAAAAYAAYAAAYAADAAAYAADAAAADAAYAAAADAAYAARKETTEKINRFIKKRFNKAQSLRRNADG